MCQTIDEWDPVDIKPYTNHPDQKTHPAINLPFKIGGLTLPMLTHNGAYKDSIACLADLLSAQHGSYFPV